MTADLLEFQIRSGGKVTILLHRCVTCETKACIAVCEIQGGPLVLDEEGEVPGLRWSPAEIERGGCVECLGCELDCALYGRQAVEITLPLAKLDEHLDSLTEPIVYQGERR